jgi:hypothetical protein
MLDNRRITITTGSMNRLEPLRRALATWLAMPEVDEVIVVDWGSRETLRDALATFRGDKRLIIVRTEQKHWHNSKCHNLELALVPKRSLWLRLDNDTLVRPDFFKLHPHQEGSFYAVNWRTVPKVVDDKRNLAGTLFVDPAYVLEIRGYNERLIHYGHEDDDLHARLVLHRYHWKEVVLDTVDHIPHPDKARYENLAAASQVAKMVAPYKVNRSFCWADRLHESSTASGELEKSMFIAMSARIAKEHPWTQRDRMSEWMVSQTSNPRYWEATERL